MPSSTHAAIDLYLLSSKAHSTLEPYILHHDMDNDWRSYRHGDEDDGASGHPPSYRHHHQYHHRRHHHHRHHDAQSEDHIDYRAELLAAPATAPATATSSTGDYFSGAASFVTSPPIPLLDYPPFPPYTAEAASPSTHHLASPGPTQRSAYRDPPYHSYPPSPNYYPLVPSPPPLPSAAAVTAATASFPCDHPSCAKAYPRLCDLRRHKKRHQKPYPCRASAECDSHFSTEKDRDRHERSRHRRDEHLECSVCGHRTARKDNMKDHVRRRHGEERVDEVMAAVVGSSSGL